MAAMIATVVTLCQPYSEALASPFILARTAVQTDGGLIEQVAFRGGGFRGGGFRAGGFHAAGGFRGGATFHGNFNRIPIEERRRGSSKRTGNGTHKAFRKLKALG
jgi:hypothetical protein